MAETIGALHIFYSYAQEDTSLAKELEKHLAAMQRSGRIIGWNNRDIQAGSEWEEEIDSHLKTAQIILLLLSPDFIASDYCYSIEMMRALERHRNGEASVIPVLLRPFDAKELPFNDLKMLPTENGPITRWQNQDEGFLNVAQGIREVVERFLSQTKEQWLATGQVRHNAEQYNQALAAYQHALALDPLYDRAQRSRGDTLYKLERYEEALEAYQIAAYLDPHHARIQRAIGDLLKDFHRYEEALAAYDAALQLDPSHMRSQNARGDVLFALKRYDEALAAYTSILKLNPEFADAYNGRGNALARLKRYDEALIAYEQAIRLNTSAPIPYNNMGRALHHMKSYSEALLAFDQALALNPHFSGAARNKADTLECLDRHEEAKLLRARARH